MAANCGSWPSAGHAGDLGLIGRERLSCGRRDRVGDGLAVVADAVAALDVILGNPVDRLVDVVDHLLDVGAALPRGLGGELSELHLNVGDMIRRQLHLADSLAEAFVRAGVALRVRVEGRHDGDHGRMRCEKVLGRHYCVSLRVHTATVVSCFRAVGGK